MTTPKGRYQKFIVGFRPEVRARQGLMFGMRQPLGDLACPMPSSIRSRALRIVGRRRTPPSSVSRWRRSEESAGHAD